MLEQKKENVILLLSCKDQQGLVYKITNFIFKIGGNIIDLDEHVDSTASMFFIRVAFEIEKDEYSEAQLTNKFTPLGNDFNAHWQIHFEEKKQNVAIFASKYDHCLQEILWRDSLNEFNINIKVIISNHTKLKNLADQNNIPFFHFDISGENNNLIEDEQIKILDKFKIDTIVLARYMQILSPDFVKRFTNRIINIHHSFLPAFIGGNPYKQAFQRGVKIIGATSHYVTNRVSAK